MSSFNLQSIFPNSAKQTKSTSMLFEKEKLEEMGSRFKSTTSKFNIQSSLVLPSIDKNISHKKLNSEYSSKTAKASDNYNVKEALKDWLVGKSDVTIEEIIKQKPLMKNQQNKRIDITTPPSADKTETPALLTSKRRQVRSKRFSQDIYESGSQSTLDSSNNHTHQDSYYYSIGGSAQSIQLPRVLDNLNQLNSLNENVEIIKVPNNGGRRLVRKVSIDIFEDQPSPRNQNNNLEIKLKQQRNNSQQLINIGNSYSNNNIPNKRESENIFSQPTSSQRISFQENYNNPTTSSQTQRFLARNNSPMSGNSTPIKMSSEQKIQFPSSIFQYQSTPNMQRFGSLQNIVIPTSFQDKKKAVFQESHTESINSYQNIDINSTSIRTEMSSRRANRKFIASSMGSIILPESIKQTKSILKGRSTKQNNTLPPILKKSVIFNDKVQKFQI